MTINSEIIDSFSRNEVMRLLNAMSDTKPIYDQYYNDMVINNDNFKFRSGYFSIQEKVPVIYLMKWRRTRSHSGENWKSVYAVHPQIDTDSYDVFYNELISIIRDRRLNSIFYK
jgi:hypothetical protein